MITAKYESRVKPEGDYECTIGKVYIDVAKSGKEYISVPLTIRGDVEQPYKNGKIYHAIWKRKEPSSLDMEMEGYSFSQLMQLCEACGIPSGTNFESLEDILNKISWKAVVCRLKHDEWNGQKQEKVHYFKKTAKPVKVKAPTYTEDLEDDGDLPF